ISIRQLGEGSLLPVQESCDETAIIKAPQRRLLDLRCRSETDLRSAEMRHFPPRRHGGNAGWIPAEVAIAAPHGAFGGQVPFPCHCVCSTPSKLLLDLRLPNWTQRAPPSAMSPPGDGLPGGVSPTGVALRFPLIATG